MKNIKNTILALSMLMAAQTIIGMESFPAYEQKRRERELVQIRTENPSSLLGLPADLQTYLLQHLATADIAETEREILVLAATNKQLINNPHVMIAILNAVAQKVTYTAHAVELAERLQKKTVTLPVMQHESICKWIAGAKGLLKKNNDFGYAIANYGLFTMNANYQHHAHEWRAKIFNYLKDKNLDINAQDGPKRTILMECLWEGYGLDAIRLCISLGVNLDIPDYRGKTCLQVATEKRRNDAVALLQEVQQIRKQKLALKQPVKQ